MVARVLAAATVAALLGGCPSGDPGPAPSGSLDVLTYNVHGLPAPIAGDDPAARMPLIAPLLREHELVGVQEAWVDDYWDALVAGDPWTTQERFDLPLNDDRVYGAGLAVLSTLPGALVRQQHYSTCFGALDGSGDCLASKGFQAVRLQLAMHGDTPVEVDVWNTHFEAGGGPEDEEARATQVEELVEAMIEVSGGRAMIFTADQNLHAWRDAADATAYERLLSLGLRDACDLVACDDPEHIDKIMVRPGGGLLLEVTDWAVEAAFVTPEGEPLSDHPAISATVAWGPDPAPGDSPQ